MKRKHIYALTEPHSEDCIRYIGQSFNPRKRFSEHICKCDKSDTPKDKWISSLVNKSLYPKLIILDSVEEKDSFFWESFYIDLLRSWGFDLTNSTLSSDNEKAYRHSKESIEKMRDYKLDQLGIIDKDKWLEERKAAKERGVIWRENKNNRKPIVVFDKFTGEFINEYNSSWEAGKDLDLNYKKIQRVLSDNPKELKHKSYKGFRFVKGHMLPVCVR